VKHADGVEVLGWRVHDGTRSPCPSGRLAGGALALAAKLYLVQGSSIQERRLVREKAGHLIALAVREPPKHESRAIHAVSSYRRGARSYGAGTYGLEEDVLREGVEDPARALEPCSAPIHSHRWGTLVLPEVSVVSTGL